MAPVLPRIVPSNRRQADTGGSQAAGADPYVPNTRASWAGKRLARARLTCALPEASTCLPVLRDPVALAAFEFVGIHEPPDNMMRGTD